MTNENLIASTAFAVKLLKESIEKTGQDSDPTRALKDLVRRNAEALIERGINPWSIKA